MPERRGASERLGPLREPQFRLLWIGQTTSAVGDALMSLSRSASNVFGPAVSGLLVATIGPGWVFAADAVTFAVSAASLLALRLPSQPTNAGGPGFLAELAGGWREVVSRRWLLA